MPDSIKDNNALEVPENITTERTSDRAASNSALSSDAASLRSAPEQDAFQARTLRVANEDSAIDYRFDTTTFEQSQQPLVKLEDANGDKYFLKAVTPLEAESHLRAIEILGKDSIVQYAPAREIAVEDLPDDLQRHYEGVDAKKLLLIDKVPIDTSLTNDLIGQGEKGAAMQAVDSSLGGKPVTVAEQQQILSELQKLADAGIIHGDLPANMTFERGEDGKLKMHVIDPWPEKVGGDYTRDANDTKGMFADMRKTGAAGLDPWDVPAFDVGKNPNETIFQNSERSVSDLLTDAQASGKDKINRKDVPLTTERALYHEVIVQLVTTRQFDDEHQLKAAVDAIKSSPEYQDVLKKANPENMSKVVGGLLDNHSATKDLKPLQSLPAQERQILVMMGGSGTGKSSVRNVLVADMQERGVNPGVVIDADAFKELLGDSKKMGLEFADLTHQESSLIVDKIRGRLDEMVKTTGKAPNAIIDKTSATPAHLEDLAKTAGTVEVHCTFCPVEEAVSRAGARGEKTGRYVPTKLILEINKEVAAGVQKLIADPSVSITIYDTDVKYGEPPKVLLEKISGTNEVIIHDINKAASLINQQEINSKAKAPEQVYSEGAKKPLSDVVQALADTGQNITLKKPGTNEKIAEIRDKKLIISDEQAFRETVGNQEADKLIAKHSEHTKTTSQGAENDRQIQQTADTEPKVVETGTPQSGKEGRRTGEEQGRQSSDIASGEPHSSRDSGREVESRQRGAVQVDTDAATRTDKTRSQVASTGTEAVTEKTKTAPVEHPNGKSPSVNNHRNSAGGNAGSLVVDINNLGHAIASGNTEAALASGGSAATNAAALTDDLLAASGKSSGVVSKVVGKAGIAGTLATTAVEMARLEAEDGINKREKQGEALVNTAVGVGGGMAGGALAATGAAALGATGFAAGAVATGGGLIVAAAATAAVAYGNQAIDGAMYGAEDKRFAANLEKKPHLIAMANGKFRDQLADPKTGEIDLTNPETYNKLSILLNRETEKQEKIIKDNSSLAPRWMRGVFSDSVITQQSAMSDLRITQSAQKELGQHINELHIADQARNSAIATINKLDQDKNGNIDIADLDRNGDGKLDKTDLDKIKAVLNNDKLANAFIANLDKSGIKFDGSVAVNTPPAQIPTGETRNTQLAAR